MQRMKEGLAPVGGDGKSVNLHHIGQSDGAPIAEVAATTHQKGFSILHSNTGQHRSAINRPAFTAWKRRYWKNRVGDFTPNGG